MKITATKLKYKDNERRVNYLAKVVTVILLVTLSLAPAVAAVPCQQGSGCMACCSGMMCPMMAKMMSREMAGQAGMRNVSVRTCRSIPHSSVAVTERQATDVAVAMVYSRGICEILPAPYTHPLRNESAEFHQRSGPRAQAVLSTFLI
jgi:hypothetical protein